MIKQIIQFIKNEDLFYNVSRRGDTMLFKILITLSFIVMFALNYLANALPIGGNTTGDISEKYNTMFTPSGYAFSIWGIIYLLLTIVLILFLWNEVRVISNGSTIIFVLIIIINLLNGLWLVCWHTDSILLSAIVMLMLLVSLLLLVSNLQVEDRLIHTTYSIYAGWISIATIANISILLYKFDFSIFMNYQLIWLIAILVIGVVIGLYMAIKEKNIAYSSVFVWAYVAILVRYISK